MLAERLVISERFCGPPGTGNGGYVCGRLARHVGIAAAVRLRAPAPLGRELRIEADGGQARLMHDAQTIAEARPATLDVAAPEPISFERATEAAAGYLGFRRHAFPRCFVCGPERAAGDGLRIFPGALSQRPLVASPWVPDPTLADEDGRVRSEFLWSALDCSGGFAVLPVPEGKAIVLGELSARISGTVAPGERCTVAGWLLGVDGRKRRAGSAVYSSTGHAVAVAQAVWIEVDSSAFGGQ
ncbi:MAG TPA: hypothetical protein VM491_16225 [Burkholderiaceae bacterium]|nr:hypothetical protein [Burkholderiaceae bacterium]